jgi:prepilin-type processing-associated H-X9-DG protein
VRNLVASIILGLIVVLVGGFLVASVAKVREAADRISCKNNLHLIATSVHEYESMNGNVTRAARPNPNLPFDRRLSWLVEILPYVQADPLYSRLALEKAWDEEDNRFAGLTMWKVFECPGYRDRPPDSTFAATHYIGIGGIGRDAAQLANDDPRAGFFGYERKITSADIAASTLVVAMETFHATGAWTAAGRATVRGLEQDGLPYLGKDGQFGGNHPGVANAVFADGSVRSLRDSMDPRVLEAIATVKGSAGVTGIDE